MSTHTSTPRLSVVVPLFNEEAGIGNFLAQLDETLLAIGHSFEIILVDDGSSDETWAKLRQLSGRYENALCIRLSRNFGKESALSAGLDLAQGEAVIVMDGDLQHPVALIPEMVAAWIAGRADVVEAVKFDRGRESFSSKVRARVFYGLLNLLSGMNLEGMSDYKLLDRRVVHEWRRLREYDRFFRGMVAWLGFRHLAIPFTVPSRTEGTSGWSLWGLIRLALGAITSFSTLPLHFSTLCGAIFAVLALLLGVQTVYNKFAGVADAGFTTVILLLLIIGSAILLSVGVIGEYVAKIYHEVKRRPTYVVCDELGRGAGAEVDKSKVDW